MNRRTPSILVVLLAASATQALAQAIPDPDSPRWKGVVALQELIGSRGPQAIDRFLEEKAAPSLRKKLGDPALRAALRGLRDDLAGLPMQGARPEGPYSAVVMFGDGQNEMIVPFRLEPDPPHRFLQIGPIGAGDPADAPPPLTWENLEQRLELEAANGFAGSVHVMRDGKVVLDRGYGMANRERQIPNRPDTIYAIGSTPIDFTRAAILLLAQRGKLELSDPITRYFDDVPADKRGITLDHLMTGRSGLEDFHGRPTDANPDHSWIDRDEAMRRIFEGELLFAPGEGRRHSHSAWGVLAAVVEIVSGRSYPEFTRENLFGPAAMKDTGFFGEEYPIDRMAIGYGDETSGEINAPPYWGPTSWLVMGSGGQTSTTGDLVRWHQALARGAILEGEWLQRYWAPPGAVLAGGDMFGFEILYTQGPETMMVLVSNDRRPPGMPAFRRLGQDLAALVNEGSRPRFSLGVQIDVQGPGRVVVVGVVPGSAAEQAGLRVGDLLLSAGGRPFGDEPMAVLGHYLETGDPVPLEIERDGARRALTVRPRPR